MKTIPTALQSRFQGEQVKNAICWVVEKKTGGALRGTSHDQNVTISSGAYAGTYVALRNISGSDVRTTSDMSVDNMEVHGAAADQSADGITFAEIRAGVIDGARVTVFVCDWSAPNDGQVVLRRGFMGNVSHDSDYGIRPEVRGLAQLLAQQIGRVLSDRCDVVEFGDSRCMFDVSSIQASGQVSSVTSNRVFHVEFFGSPLPTWEYLPAGGKIEVTSGNNSGFEREVKTATATSTGLTVELYEEMADDVAVGDQVMFTPGCDRRYSTCQYYGNLVNFRGWGVFVPGALAMMRGASVSAGDCLVEIPFESSIAEQSPDDPQEDPPDSGGIIDIPPGSADGNLVWDLNFENGLLGGRVSGNAPIVSTARAREGSRSMYSELNRLTDNTSYRTELAMNEEGRRGIHGTSTWTGFSIFVPSDWAFSSIGGIVFQWHSAGGATLGLNPEFALRIINDYWHVTILGDSRALGSVTRPYESLSEIRLPGTVARGQWTDWVLHQRWGYNLSQNPRTEVWRNGEKLVTNTKLNAFNDNGTYAKCGLYWPQWKKSRTTPSDVTNTREIYHDAIRISVDGSGSYQLVAPRGSPP